MTAKGVPSVQISPFRLIMVCYCPVMAANDVVLRIPVPGIDHPWYWAHIEKENMHV
jgi:hypothetical protein